VVVTSQKIFPGNQIERGKKLPEKNITPEFSGQRALQRTSRRIGMDPRGERGRVLDRVPKERHSNKEEILEFLFSDGSKCRKDSSLVRQFPRFKGAGKKELGGFESSHAGWSGGRWA